MSIKSVSQDAAGVRSSGGVGDRRFRYVLPERARLPGRVFLFKPTWLPISIEPRRQSGPLPSFRWRPDAVSAPAGAGELRGYTPAHHLGRYQYAYIHRRPRCSPPSCSSRRSRASAITGTQWVEDFEHPYVGLVVFYDSSGEFVWRCSGSLISPTKFLTARTLHRQHARRCGRAGCVHRPGLFSAGCWRQLRSGNRGGPGLGVSGNLCRRDLRRHLHDSEHARPVAQLRIQRLRRLPQHTRRRIGDSG